MAMFDAIAVLLCREGEGWFLALRQPGLADQLLGPLGQVAAEDSLLKSLSDLSARGLTSLLACGFALSGTSELCTRLDEKRADWQALWRRAARWPRQQAEELLKEPCTGLEIPRHRATEHCSGHPGTGPYLAGIASLQTVLVHPELAGMVRVWPFQTGLTALDRPAPGTVLVAELMPGSDDALKRLTELAHLDHTGRLGPLFAGDPTLSADIRQTAERAEGWQLGVVGKGGAPSPDYIRDPAAIYQRSFAIIRSEASLAAFSGAEQDVAVRVIHACGMPEIAEDLIFAAGAAEAGRAALAAGKPVLVDVEMVSHGIIRRRLTAGNTVLCTLNDPSVAGLAAELGTTRSAAAAELWRNHLEGAVVAIGNAPTALFHLMQMIQDGAPRPAAVLGFPVGFVGAAESKEALIAADLPFIALRGRRGGSAMAAAAVNALSGGNQ